MRVSPLIVALCSIALAVPITAQEALSLGRYRVRLELNAGPGVQVATKILDQDAFEDRCRDDDGCEITMVLQGISDRVLRGRIFLFTESMRWVALNGTVHANADGNTEIVADINVNTDATCQLWDADDSQVDFDFTEGFVFRLALDTNKPATKCVLTVMD